MNRNIFIFGLMYIFLNCIYCQENTAPYCQNYPDADALDSRTLPALPGEFQTRIELSVSSTRESTLNLNVFYDSYDNRGQLFLRENGVHAREIFYYDKNEIFSIINDTTCQVGRLDDPSNSNFFGVTSTQDGLTMKPPEYVLHFNNGFNHVKGNETFYRGIPVIHYKSCQQWPEKNASFHVDFYFSRPEFQPGVVFLEEFKSLPVATVVEGLAEINPITKVGRKFRNEYNYFEFRTLIADKTGLYQLPSGLFCEGQTDKQQVPKIPFEFSFTEEIVIDGERSAQTNKVYYSYTNKVARFDVIGPREFNLALDTYKVIHDFTSGVSYAIDKETEFCRIKPLGTEFLDTLEKPFGLASSLVMKDPQQMFFLDDTYFYAGEKMERGILCDVFISNRTDFRMPNVTVQPSYWVFEIYFMNIRQTNMGSDGIERVTPVAIKISSPGINRKYHIHIYDFDSKLEATAFDYSVCFQGKKRIDFGIKYNYPSNLQITPENFNILRDDAVSAYYTELVQVFSLYNMSPMRIIPPTFVPLNNSFILYSGVIDSAPAINHFQKKEQTQVDIMLTDFKIPSSSPELCAQTCLNGSSIEQSLFKCLSFDYCPTEQACTFYNFSLTTDPSIVSESSPLCDHYSKTVELFDAASKESIFREIQDLVVKKEFNLNILGQEDVILATFTCEDIFLATLQATSESYDSIPIGTTLFYKQFLIFSFDSDFNLNEINQDPSLQVRQRKGISIDECTRLCLKEPAFRCESLTYENSLTECKWSSFVASILLSASNIRYISPSEGYTFFIRDPLYDFTPYPSQTTSLTNNKIIDVDTENQCAYYCNNEKGFTCKSFNLCKNNNKYKCLLSDTHVDNIDKNSNLVYSPICTHYSKNTLDDFKLVPKTQMSVSPQAKYFNTTVETCSQMCTFIDAYVCRSFDFFLNENTCYLYKENLKDINFPGVYGVANADCSHYSRTYIVENGIKFEVMPDVNAETKYSGGSIFGIVLAITLATTIVGFVIAFFVIKRINANKTIPVMNYVNPGYAN